MVSDINSKISTIGYIFIIVGMNASWISKLQKVLSLSTMGAKYVVVIEASKKII